MVSQPDQGSIPHRLSLLIHIGNGIFTNVLFKLQIAKNVELKAKLFYF